MDTKMSPKIDVTIGKNRVPFWSSVLLRDWTSSGVSWERLGCSEVALGSLGSPKTYKNKWFFKFCANPRLPAFGVLDGRLCPILAPAGKIRSSKWFPGLPKSYPKTGPKNGPRDDPKIASK